MWSPICPFQTWSKALECCFSTAQSRHIAVLGPHVSFLMISDVRELLQFDLFNPPRVNKENYSYFHLCQIGAARWLRPSGIVTHGLTKGSRCKCAYLHFRANLKVTKVFVHYSVLLSVTDWVKFLSIISSSLKLSTVIFGICRKGAAGQENLHAANELKGAADRS